MPAPLGLRIQRSRRSQPSGHSLPFTLRSTSLMSGRVSMKATGLPSTSAIKLICGWMIGFSFLPA